MPRMPQINLENARYALKYMKTNSFLPIMGIHSEFKISIVLWRNIHQNLNRIQLILKQQANMGQVS
jgi:hypothetical protein